MTLGASDLNIIIKATDQASSTMKGVAKEVGGLGSALGSVAKVAGGIALVGIAAAGAAVVALGSALFDFTKAAMEAELVQASFDAVLKSTSGTMGRIGPDALGMANALVIGKQAANDLATALSNVTMFDDEMVLGAEAVMLRFQSIGKDVFPVATKAALDLATVMGTDAASAATTLGKALETPGEGLLRLKAAGVAFSDEEVKMLSDMVAAGQGAEAQSIILDRLNESIGGAAEAAGATAQGQWTIFSNQMQNVKESIGAAMLEPLTKLGTALSETLAKPEVQAAIEKIAGALGELAGTVLPLLINMLPAVVAGISDIAVAVTTIVDAITSGDWTAIEDALKAKATEWGASIWDGIRETVALGDPTTNQALADALSNEDMKAKMGVSARAAGASFAQSLTDFFSTDVTENKGILAWFSNLSTQGVGAMNLSLAGAGQTLLDGLMGAIGGPGGRLGMDATIAWGGEIAGGFVSGMWDTISKLWSETDWASLGKGIIDGIVAGIEDSWGSIKAKIEELAQSLPQWMRDVLGMSSPSTVFAEIGTNITLGLIQGIEATRATVSSTVQATVNETFKVWWGAIKSRLGHGGLGSNIRRMFQDWMRDWLSTATVGVGETTGDLVARMLAAATAQFGPGVASILQSFAGEWQALLGGMAGMPASGTMFNVIDAIMGAAGRLGGVGSAAADRYTRTVIDPMREELRLLEEEGTQLEKIAALKDQIAAAEARTAALAQQQADLQWLTAQLDLIKLIKENGLNAASILGDITLGLGADPAAIMDAMTAAMQQMLAQAQASFSGFGVAVSQWMPDWLIPGSPTDFELGLRGIGRAMDTLGVALPTPLAMSPAYGMAAGGNAGPRVTVVYSPAFSAVDAHEAAYRLKPLIEAAVRKVMR